MAPDYLLVRRELAGGLVRELKASIEGFYGPDPRQSPDYPRIINARHFERLRGLLPGGRVVPQSAGDAREVGRGPS